jgi:hypothetical protein
MSFENGVLTLTKPAAAAMTTPFLLVKPDGSGKLTPAGVGDVAVGVLQNKPAAADVEAAYMAVGVSRVVCSAGITEGQKVAPAAGGKARTAVSGDHVAGIALETSTALDQIIAVLLCSSGAPLV